MTHNDVLPGRERVRPKRKKRQLQGELRRGLLVGYQGLDPLRTSETM